MSRGYWDNWVRSWAGSQLNDVKPTSFAHTMGESCLLSKSFIYPWPIQNKALQHANTEKLLNGKLYWTC